MEASTRPVSSNVKKFTHAFAKPDSIPNMWYLFFVLAKGTIFLRVNSKITIKKSVASSIDRHKNAFKNMPGYGFGAAFEDRNKDHSKPLSKVYIPPTFSTKELRHFLLISWSKALRPAEI